MSSVVEELVVSHQEFLDDVFEGLSKNQKTLPCKYFYDEQGSMLFEKICQLDEYYVTRTEVSLLHKVGTELSGVIGPDVGIVELGSGAGEKIRLLLNMLASPKFYIPVDISEEILFRSGVTIKELFPDITVLPLVGDFSGKIDLAKLFDVHIDSSFSSGVKTKNVVFFPGSTIGNFSPEEAKVFLNNIAESVGPDGGLVIGVDLIKDVAVLEDAYNDAKGITAKFNSNLLVRINKELGGDFCTDSFEHKSHFNVEKSRIEMHLVSAKNQVVNVDDRAFLFSAGESIHSENSYKYSVESFHDLAVQAGFKVIRTWVDDNDLFSIHYLEPA